MRSRHHGLLWAHGEKSANLSLSADFQIFSPDGGRFWMFWMVLDIVNPKAKTIKTGQLKWFWLYYYHGGFSWAYGAPRLTHQQTSYPRPFFFFFVWFSSSEHQGPTKLKHQIGSSKLIESSNLGIKNFEPYLWPHLFNCSTFFDHWPKTRPRKGIKRTKKISKALLPASLHLQFSWTWTPHWDLLETALHGWCTQRTGFPSCALRLVPWKAAANHGWWWPQSSAMDSGLEARPEKSMTPSMTIGVKGNWWHPSWQITSNFYLIYFLAGLPRGLISSRL